MEINNIQIKEPILNSDSESIDNENNILFGFLFE